MLIYLKNKCFDYAGKVHQNRDFFLIGTFEYNFFSKISAWTRNGSRR